MTERNYWFGHKGLGAGLAPSSWQGWLCLLVFVVAFAWTLKEAPDLFADHETGVQVSIGLAVVETIAFFWIVWAKRDKGRAVRWRWFGRG
jgi:hypothetical protein